MNITARTNLNLKTAKFFLGAAILLLPQILSDTSHAQATAATLPEAPIPAADAAPSLQATESVDPTAAQSGSSPEINLAQNDGQTQQPPQSQNTKPTPPANTSQPSSSSTAPSLADLGLTPSQVQGSAQAQATLDKRTHMLKVHQRLGLLTMIPLVATVISSADATAGHHGTGGTTGNTASSNTAGRDLHASLGSVTVGMYAATAYYAIRAPKIPGTPTRGAIRVHKALVWIHGPGMILTPIFGAIAFKQLNAGEKVHGIASIHSEVAWVTVAAYSASIVSVSWPIKLKF